MAPTLNKDGSERAKMGRPAKMAPPCRKTLQMRLVEYDCDPSTILILIAMGDSIRLKTTEEIPIELRCKAASELCGYLMPKLRAVELTGEVVTKPSSVLMIPEVKSMDEWKSLVNAAKDNAERVKDAVLVEPA